MIKQMEQVAQLEQAVAALESAAADMDKQSRQVESLAQSLPLLHLSQRREAERLEAAAATTENAPEPTSANVPTESDLAEGSDSPEAAAQGGSVDGQDL